MPTPRIRLGRENVELLRRYLAEDLPQFDDEARGKILYTLIKFATETLRKQHQPKEGENA